MRFRFRESIDIYNAFLLRHKLSAFDNEITCFTSIRILFGTFGSILCPKISHRKYWNKQHAKKEEEKDGGGGGGGDDQKEKEEQDKKDQEKNEKDNKGDGDQKEKQEKKPEDDKQGEQKQPRPNQLSKQQIQNLLEAMQNEEKKVQQKIDAKKVKGVKVKNEKDW